MMSRRKFVPGSPETNNKFYYNKNRFLSFKVIFKDTKTADDRTLKLLNLVTHVVCGIDYLDESWKNFFPQSVSRFISIFQ